MHAGKTFLLRHLVAALRAQHGPAAVALTALTGVAALTLGGVTLHSWAGLGLAQLAPGLLLHNARQNADVGATCAETPRLFF